MQRRPFVVLIRVERLNWPEICRRHPDQWVVLADIAWRDSRTSALESAIVLGHGSTRDAAINTARRHLDQRSDEFACFYTKRYIFWMRPNGRPGGSPSGRIRPDDRGTPTRANSARHLQGRL
jgi:hypothetical protein